MIFRTQFSTVLGEMSAAATEQGVCFLEFTEDNRREDTLQLVSSRLKMAVTDGNHPHLALLESQLQDYFAGKRMIFTVPLVLPGTPFQQKVWDALLSVPFGSTVTYSMLAASLSSPRAVRAVGRANGMNPVSVLVPCHRVTGKNGELTGYAGGTDRKAWLLAHEKQVKGASA
ncbi:TPA: methylated-DNA--[protein]-cysteine S-methyltransferase [Morganella morganii subsp. morganii]|nr:methylated-DNA--[protein]-cysteine S-methyltransferase [Morganella morganii subsp. morganii]HDU8672541.1 methylated-DNA--[protein]-cysteine S-methyltransferase [Morganella morganii subsp. morganii]